jgi:hypothetical protein
MTTINEVETLSLLDGTTFEVSPLRISLLRKFMATFDKIQAVADNNDKSMDLLIECARIALEQYKPEVAEDAKKLEDIIDLPTVYKVIEAASGIKLGDGNSLV